MMFISNYRSIRTYPHIQIAILRSLLEKLHMTAMQQVITTRNENFLWYKSKFCGSNQHHHANSQLVSLTRNKDSVFACILNDKGIVFQEKVGVLTPGLEQLAATLQEHDVSEVCTESSSIPDLFRDWDSLQVVERGFASELFLQCRGRKKRPSPPAAEAASHRASARKRS